MRVPEDPDRPTFDHTFNVGLFRWLTSSKADRVEWARRRDAAAQAAKQVQNTRIEAWRRRKIAEQEARRRDG